MGKITISSTIDGYLLSHKLIKGEDVNVREFDIIARGGMQQLLPVSVDTKKKQQLICSVNGCMTLENYLKTPINKRTFLEIIAQVLDLTKSCKEKNMHMESIEFEHSQIFVDIKTQKLRFVYWPIVNFQQVEDVVDFLKNIAYTATFLKTEDTEYVYKYIHYMDNATPFSFNSFERFINEKIANSDRIINQAFAESVDARTSRTEDERKNIAYMPSYGEKKPVMQAKEVEQKVAPQYSTERLIIEATDEQEKTAFLGDGRFSKEIAYLVREKTGEKKLVDKPLFLIGRNQSSMDYAISDNKSISRHHASIVSEDNRYYLIDNDSINKTVLDGIPLIPNEKTEMFSGAKLMFSNEEFTFMVEQL